MNLWKANRDGQQQRPDNRRAYGTDAHTSTRIVQPRVGNGTLPPCDPLIWVPSDAGVPSIAPGACEILAYDS